MYDYLQNQQCGNEQHLYVIQAGDTVYKLAKRFSTSVRAILSLNPGLKLQKLNAGESIYIPNSSQYTSYPRINCYRVIPGSTLSEISRFFNISLSELMEVNPGTNPRQPLFERIVCIPEGAAPAFCPSEMIVYNVQSGDKLYLIALRFNVKIEEIVQANPNVNMNALYIGQNLCIPVKWSLYFDQKLNVSFRYPSSWMKIDLDSREKIRFEGEDGFFEIRALPRSRDKAIEIKPVDEICGKYACDGIKSFGNNPKTEKAMISNQPACYILPSDGQPQELKGMAALLVRYPGVIFLSGLPYAYFLLYSEEKYIKEIGESLRFIKD